LYYDIVLLEVWCATKEMVLNSFFFLISSSGVLLVGIAKWIL
jgi:hypothetical protein